MECRCYRGDKNRTKLVKLEYKARDYILMLVFALFMAAIITLSVLPDSSEALGILYNILFYRV